MVQAWDRQHPPASWRSNGLTVVEALPAVVTFFLCSEPMFCPETPLAKPEEAWHWYRLHLVSSLPAYGEVLLALLSWMAALQADKGLAWHTLFMLHSLSVKTNIYL